MESADPGMPLMAALKSATARSHADLERMIDLDAVLRGGLGAYRRLLACFLGAFEPLERTIAPLPWPKVGFEPEAGRRSGQLRDDLGSLGLSTAEIAASPRCHEPPAVDGLDRGFGLLYVLEGSALGGRVVLRRIGPALGVDEMTGASFFAGPAWPAPPLERWRAFGRAADAFLAAEPGSRRAIIESAVAAFEGLHRWFRDFPVDR